MFSRTLRCRNRTIYLPNGSEPTFLVGEEKGIDVRIALDIIALAHRLAYDVAVILSQDQDLSETLAFAALTVTVAAAGCTQTAEDSAYPTELGRLQILGVHVQS